MADDVPGEATGEITTAGIDINSEVCAIILPPPPLSFFC